jgi:lipopolysaccharide biosynthesis glycosyltransferase
MTATARIYIGFDRKEVVAYHVLCQSILEKSTIPVSFTPIALNNVEDIFTRERNSLQSTEFSISRFLVPHLSNFEGWSLFIDCDMLVRTDIAKLWALRDERFAAMCVKHDYVPKIETKFLGQVQTKYVKKNWSSVILFNNEKCKKLDLNYVNTAMGLELHQFKWLESDDLIGDLPVTWNWLVNEYDYLPDADLVHFTDGGPYFDEYKNDDYAEEWFAARDRACAATGGQNKPRPAEPKQTVT